MKKRIIFLYLYGLHQLYHSAMTAMELGQFDENYEVLCLSCNSEHTEVLTHILGHYPNSRTQIIQLKQPIRYKYFNFKKKSYPSVNAMIRIAKKYLVDADIIVTTSHGTPNMLNKFKIKKPRLIYQFHGCGDRKYSFDPKYKLFDKLLIPGFYHKERLLEEKIVPIEKLSIIGYPKMDTPLKLDKLKKDLFDNNNKIAIYTPHWEPELTSYKIWGEKVLTFFKENKDYNLIFAPHIQLKHWKHKCGYNINLDGYKAENIHIDFGSINSVNNAYTNLADIYIGDVSSQIYEFYAYNPRPSIFLNPFKFKWKGNIDFRFWELGDVIEEFTEFEDVFKKSIKENLYEKEQEERIVKYIDLTEVKSSFRAAKVISEFVNNE